MQQAETRPHLLVWLVLNPLREKDSLDLLSRFKAHPKVVGIKLHPVLHKLPLHPVSASVNKSRYERNRTLFGDRLKCTVNTKKQLRRQTSVFSSRFL